MGMLEQLEQRLGRLEFRHPLSPELQEKLDAVIHPELKLNILDFAYSSDQVLLVFNINEALELSRATERSNQELSGKVEALRSKYDASIEKYFGEIITSINDAAVKKNYTGAAMNFITASLNFVREEARLRQELINELFSRESQAYINYFGEIAMSLQVAREAKTRINDNFDKVLNRLRILSEARVVAGEDYSRGVDLIFMIRREAIALIDFFQEKNQDRYEEIKQDLRAVKKDPCADLFKQIVGTFLVSTAETARIHSPSDLRKVPRMIMHSRRDREIARLLNLSPIMRERKVTASAHSKKIQALIAKLKRIHIRDFNADNYDQYTDSKTRIEKIIHLISRIDLDFVGLLSLYDDYILNQVDRFAFLELAKEIMAPKLGTIGKLKAFTMHSYQYFRNYEKEVTAEFKFLLADGNINELRRRIEVIISFYVRNMFGALLQNDDLISFSKNPVKQFEQRKIAMGHTVAILNRELSDPTPSAYYNSPLCGLAQFIASQAGQGQINLYIWGPGIGRVGISYIGENFDGLERGNDQNFKKFHDLKADRINYGRRVAMMRPMAFAPVSSRVFCVP